EVPHEAGAFQAPEVPALLVVHAGVLVEGEVDLLQPAIGLDDLHHLVGILLAIRRQDRAHDSLDESELVLVQLARADARLPLPGRTEANRPRLLTRTAGDDGHLALLLRQGIEDTEDRPGLVVEDVAAAVARGTVAVEHRPAEGDAVLRFAVAADGQVMAGEHPGIFPL